MSNKKRAGDSPTGTRRFTLGSRETGVSPNSADHELVAIPVSIMMSRGAADRLRSFMTKGKNRFVLASADGAVAVKVSVSMSHSSSPEEVIPQLNNATIDWDRGAISHDGRVATLSRTELRLLACLVEHRGATVPHDVLIRSAWGIAPDDAGYNALAVYVCYLRRSLKMIGLKQALHTNRGVGYSLGDPERVGSASSGQAAPRFRPAVDRADGEDAVPSH